MRCEDEEREEERILYLIFDFMEIIFQAPLRLATNICSFPRNHRGIRRSLGIFVKKITGGRRYYFCKIYEHLFNRGSFFNGVRFDENTPFMGIFERTYVRRFKRTYVLFCSNRWGFRRTYVRFLFPPFIGAFALAR